jgi:tetratricopeptide (TPR) repeat protein
MRATAEEAIAIFAELGDDEGQARAWWRLAGMNANAGRMAMSSAALEQALVHADAARLPLLRTQIVAFLVNQLSAGPAPVETAVGRGEELLETSRGQPVLAATIESSLFLLCAMAARTEDAREYGEKSRVVLDQLGYRMLLDSRRQRAAAHLLLGDAAAAEDELVSMWRSYALTQAIARTAVMGAHELALLCCDQGRWDDAAHWLELGAEGPPAPPGTLVSIARPAVAARLAAHAGEPDEALALAHEAVEVAEQTDRLNQRAVAWLALAEVHRARDETPAADAAVDAAVRLYEQKGNVAAVTRLRTPPAP